jgi:hypothetical protein
MQLANSDRKRYKFKRKMGKFLLSVVIVFLLVRTHGQADEILVGEGGRTLHLAVAGAEGI